MEFRISGWHGSHLAFVNPQRKGDQRVRCEVLLPAYKLISAEGYEEVHFAGQTKLVIASVFVNVDHNDDHQMVSASLCVNPDKGKESLGSRGSVVLCQEAGPTHLLVSCDPLPDPPVRV